jgi:cellulose synthase/poly-beta-1,6-N-acetylglucosamine synthase-like glycosyltransferase
LDSDKTKSVSIPEQFLDQERHDKNAISRAITPPLKQKFAPITIVIPAYNEESAIGAVLTSLFKQSVLPEQIIVVNDCSSDRTAQIARSFDGVTVVSTPENTGSKGSALNYGLQHVDSRYTVTIDADITLEDDAVKKMIELMESRPEISAMCTFILPNFVRTIWERFRFVEYIFSLSFYKSVQQMYDSILICSGCFTIYKTSDLKSVGGWPLQTVAEDMELTWLLYEKGKHIGYNENTFCYSREPENLRLMSKQLKRWNTGFFHVFRLKGKNIMRIPVLREFVFTGIVDAFLGTIFHAAILYLAISHQDPSRYLYFLGLDLVLLCIPSFWLAAKMKKVRTLAKAFPTYLIVRLFASFWFYYAFVSSIILRKDIKKFEKGHQ